MSEAGGEASPRQRRSGESLQFYDPASGLGVFAGLGRMGPASMGGRLLLFLGGQRVALFTGEEIGADQVPPLCFERSGNLVRLRFDGPILLLEDAGEYLDLEAALAASRSVEVSLSLELRESGGAAGSASFGDVGGEITVDGRRSLIDTQGFGHVAALRTGGQAQTMLAASFGTGRALVGRMSPNGEGSSVVHFDGVSAERLDGVRLHVIEDGDAYTPAAFELRSTAWPPLRAETLNRMAILRSAAEGYLRVAFGVARFEWDGAEGFGLYEHALPLAAAGRD